MRHRVLPLTALTAVLLVITGCEATTPTIKTGPARIPEIDSESARAAGLTPDDIRAASILYTSKCGRCHQFYNPAAYNEEQWRLWMQKMSNKARLNREQEVLLSKYLNSIRNQKVRTTPNATRTRSLPPN